MTPAERAFLQAAGILLSSHLLGVSITVLFFGVFIGLCVLASHSLLKRSSRYSWAKRAQLAALFVTFVTGAGSSLADPAEFSIIAAHLNSQPDAINTEIAPYGIVLAWTQQISLLINDIVVIWRAWVLYRDRPVVLFPLCLIFFATLATGFASLALISQITEIVNSSRRVSSTEVSAQKTLAYKLNTTATALSLATNLAATTLIFIQLWRHHKFINRSGFLHHSLTSSQRILLFLVEAGFVFCIGQVVSLSVGIHLNADSNITSAAYLALSVIDIIFWASLPLYLPTIILLVENNHTIVETFGFDTNLLAEEPHVEMATSHPERGA